MTASSPRLTGAIAFALAALLPLAARAEKASDKEQAEADRISKEMSALRGLPLKQRIEVENQSIEDFKKFVSKELDAQMPEKRELHYGKVARALGLNRGPEIKDYRELSILVASSQAAAYYDPETKKFYVLKHNMNEMMMGTVYAHELTHGLQDQSFDLDKYLIEPAGKTINDDEQIARQAVVEGEATYTMTLWQMKEMTGELPDRESLGMIVDMQANMDVARIRGMLAGGNLEELGLGGMEDAVKAMDEIPNFVLETMMGAYMKGMAFVHAVQAEGWDKVGELYKNPPASSEQILHPAKWFGNEKPHKLEWPDFEKAEALKGWELLDSNVIGELQWRVIFAEQGLGRESKKAADGWDGDSYAVLMDKDGKLLTLIQTCWDSEKEAGEFAKYYNRAQKAKFPNNETPATLEADGNEVAIIEGADDASLEGLKAFMKQIKKAK